MNHLALWIVAAIVATAAVGVATIGFAAPTPFVLLHAPAVLAAMLLARATVLVLRGESFALQWRNRRVMGGKTWLWGPALLLLAWTMLREAGVLDVNACLHENSTNTQCISQAWTDRQNEPLLEDQRIRVFAPDNAFGRAIDDELADRWIYGLRAAHAEITIEAETPFAPWPLYKSTGLHCTVRGMVQLHSASSGRTVPVRCSSFELTIDGTFTSLGFASQRKHRQWIGQCIGEATRQQLEKLVRSEPQ
jgi:hypothetical protein